MSFPETQLFASGQQMPPHLCRYLPVVRAIMAPCFFGSYRFHTSTFCTSRLSAIFCAIRRPVPPKLPGRRCDSPRNCSLTWTARGHNVGTSNPNCNGFGLGRRKLIWTTCLLARSRLLRLFGHLPYRYRRRVSTRSFRMGTRQYLYK